MEKFKKEFQLDMEKQSKQDWKNIRLSRPEEENLNKSK